MEPAKLRIAVPNKGSLAAAAAQMLTEAGYRQRADPKDLVCHDQANSVDFFYLRPRDIATYVGSGDLDLGVTGRDLLVDSGSPATEVLDLGFAPATFRFAARPGVLVDERDVAGRRIATSYAGVVGAYLAERGLTAEVVRLDGAVENAVRLGVADVIADVVQTGTTLRQAGLVTVGEPILRSTAVLIGRGDPAAEPAAAQLLHRLQGVLVARRYVMVVYDVPVELLDRASALTPGIESPTVSQLHREGWVAVQSMVQRAAMHRVMDELYDLGARAILVTDIHACRL
ncbi:ATP phosphoribosyltransferase [Pilimelia terevasa]|uniref:ATP phosphoribosyltransferase n=1 Tax=Pilimelia terevasa TaxID=53372 RepID=A0A8J3FH80_9ACTN|nr:ATP phosphoribosyltransferase [Pilimelia terevasa]GGK25059.1 ATP phosphoribosyltransferase [Pilimelia terevasa]